MDKRVMFRLLLQLAATFVRPLVLPSLPRSSIAHATSPTLWHRFVELSSPGEIPVPGIDGLSIHPISTIHRETV